MKNSYKLNYAIGFISFLESKLISNLNLEKLKEIKTTEEFSNFLKKIKYEINSFKDYEDFEEKLSLKLNKTLMEIFKISPKTDEFYYTFCRNDFINFKISLKLKFFKIEKKDFAMPSIIKSEKIYEHLNESCLEENCFPFEKSIKKIKAIALKNTNIKILDISIDKEMYEFLLFLAKNNSFLKERTKLEITLKNICFCSRFLNYGNNFKELEGCLIGNGLIEKEKILNSAKEGFEGILKILKEFKIKTNANSENLEEIEEEILNNFDENSNFDCLSYVPIFLYIKNLKKEITTLKQKLLNLTYKF